MKNEEDTKNDNRTLTVSFSGVWITAWLFTLGFADLSFWRGLLALLIWPYYVGTTTAGFAS